VVLFGSSLWTPIDANQCTAERQDGDGHSSINADLPAVWSDDVAKDACLFFHKCVHCHRLMRPKAGDCCVFCSHGSEKCPLAQMQSACTGR
jgi:hypothetical protein